MTIGTIRSIVHESFAVTQIILMGVLEQRRIACCKLGKDVT